MPHLNLEYSKNLQALDANTLLLRLNHALVASGQFDNELDIKSRAQAFEQFRVGTGLGERAFAHVKLSILSGRSAETKRQLSSQLLDVLKDTLSAQVGLDLQLCVEILDIDRDSYSKVHLPA